MRLLGVFMRDQKFSPLLISDSTLSKAEKGLLCTLWNFEISLSLSLSLIYIKCTFVSNVL